MLRRGLLWLSEQQQVFNFVRRNRLAKRFASRFVAGETAVEGARAAEGLAQRGITATLDLLGESVHKAEASEAAAAQYVALLERMAQSPGIEVNASVKLTQMGFDLDDDLCFRNVSRILDRARGLNGFVRMDMESSAHTQRTLDFFSQRLLPVYGTQRVGVVIQSALRRSAEETPPGYCPDSPKAKNGLLIGRAQTSKPAQLDSLMKSSQSPARKARKCLQICSHSRCIPPAMGRRSEKCPSSPAFAAQPQLTESEPLRYNVVPIKSVYYRLSHIFLSFE